MSSPRLFDKLRTVNESRTVPAVGSMRQPRRKWDRHSCLSPQRTGLETCPYLAHSALAEFTLSKVEGLGAGSGRRAAASEDSEECSCPGGWLLLS